MCIFKQSHALAQVSSLGRRTAQVCGGWLHPFSPGSFPAPSPTWAVARGTYSPASSTNLPASFAFHLRLVRIPQAERGPLTASSLASTHLAYQAESGLQLPALALQGCDLHVLSQQRAGGLAKVPGSLVG